MEKDKMLFKRFKEDVYRYQLVDEQLARKTIQDEAELNEELDYIEEEYLGYNAKADLILDFGLWDLKVQERYLQVINEILSLNNESAKGKLTKMLSYTVLVSRFCTIEEKSNDYLITLAGALRDVDKDDYTFYVAVLKSDEVTAAICDKSEDLEVRIAIARSIMDQQDELPYEFVTSENYESLIGNAVTVASEFVVGRK
ncbi:MAG: hypothetical protein RR290_04605 [Clostridia bacterium]